MVAIAENARIPVDNPATHLELTMVHEAMVLEYSGRHLAMIELAGSLKLLLYVSLIACVFVPWGWRRPAPGRRLWRRLRAYLVKLAVGGFLLALFETAIAKMRVFRVPEFLGAALMLGLLGTLLLFVSRSSDGRPRLRHRPPARRRPGAGQLHAALPGPPVRAAQRLRAARRGAGALGRLAGLRPGRAAPLRHRRDRARLQGDRHPGRAAPDRQRLGIHREIETVVGIGPTMLAGMGLVALSMVVMLRVTADADPLAREDLAFALSVVLLGLLMMVTRRNAVSQVVGFMSLENGLVLAATGAKGMPLVVEISVAFSILIAFIVIGIFLFRIRERFDTVDVHALDASGESGDDAWTAFDAVAAVLLIPLGAAALLALLPGYRLTARLNVLAAC
jgi:hypothetical protein